MTENETMTRQPARATVTTTTDSLGRKLSLKKLDALAELDLIEAAGGKNAGNARWMMMATLAACVREIDGVMVPYPADRDGVRYVVERVGAEGIQAVMAKLAEDDAAPSVAGEGELLATAKN